MKKKITVLTLSAMLLALGVSAQAQQPAKVRKIQRVCTGSDQRKALI